ncbi:hypothetical protein [Amycolatopsis minnesotensis]|uniref:hypothetical protein n=1 Tax=Amycolatopsis minnesotensis TaxID=337894 RepID=UPI0031D3673E
MRTRDAGGREWELSRRLSPWRRVIQPINLAFGRYRRYQVVPIGGAEETPRERARRERAIRASERREIREGMMDRGGWWLLAWPALALWQLIAGFCSTVADRASQWFRVVSAVVLLPFALVELIAQLLAGGVLLLARAIGMARSRVDVLAHPQHFEAVHSLTVLSVAGFGAAGKLVEALRQHLARTNQPFEPAKDQYLAGMLAHFGATVEQHVGMSIPDSGAGWDAARAVDDMMDRSRRW